MNEELIIYTDGGARGNPGPAGIGVVIYNNSQAVIKKTGLSIGNGTNNQAEYKALILGLTQASELGAKKVFCFLDSELVVKQLLGQYKVKEPELKNLISQALSLTNKFSQVEFKHVPREKNKLADELVNKALDEAGF